MGDSLERIPIRGECLKCTCTDTMSVVYAKVGFDLWFDCVNCGEIATEEFKRDKSVELESFADQILEGEGLSDDSTSDG